MAEHLPQVDAGAVAELLHTLASLLDDAQEPMKRLELSRIEELTQKQHELIRQFGPVLSNESSDGFTGKTSVKRIEPHLIAEVRRKLLRNRAVATHMVDFSARFLARISPSEEGEYGSDGQVRQGRAAGTMLRTSM